MAYKRKSTQEIKKEVNQLLEGGLNAIKQFSVSVEERIALLDFMSDFYNYSSRNQSLILSQFHGAYGVGSYNFFKEQGFHVKKGEKGIKILRPNFYKLFIDEEGKQRFVTSASNQEKVLIQNGVLKSWEMRDYKPASVFDITQTNAKPEDYPKLFPNKRAAFDYDNSLDLAVVSKGIQKIADQLSITIESEATSKFGVKELGAAKGQFMVAMTDEKEIVLNHRNTPTENIATSIHELAHAYLHNPLPSDGLKIVQEELSRPLKEFQAEMVSYIVSRHIGIDTREKAIPYVANWTDHLAVLEEQGPNAQFELLDNVQKASRVFIDILEEELTPYREQLLEQKTVVNTQSVHQLKSFDTSATLQEKVAYNFLGEDGLFRSDYEVKAKQTGDWLDDKTYQLTNRFSVNNLVEEGEFSEQLMVTLQLENEQLSLTVNENLKEPFDQQLVGLTNIQENVKYDVPLDQLSPSQQEALQKFVDQPLEGINSLLSTLDTHDKVIEQNQSTKEKSLIEQFTTRYGLSEDKAFTQSMIENLMAKNLKPVKVAQEIDSIRKETIVDWAYNGTKSAEEIKQYKEEQALNLKQKVIDGHSFFQVGEAVELMIVPSEGDQHNLIQMDQVGAITTYQCPSLQAASDRLIQLGAFSVPELPNMKAFLSNQSSRNHQNHMIHNQVMRETYQEETGRSM